MLPACSARILCRHIIRYSRPKNYISLPVSCVAMAEQIVFSRAVGFHFPTAIPVKLERVDEFAVGKVCCYRLLSNSVWVL